MKRALAFVALTALVACKKDAPSPPAPSAPALEKPAPEAIALPFLTDFEGTLSLRVSNAEKPQGGEVTFHIRKDTARVELPTGVGLPVGGWALISGPEKRIYGVMDAQKTAYFLDLVHAKDQIGKLSPKVAGAAKTPVKQTPQFQLKRTGKRDVVASIPCEEWEFSPDAAPRPTSDRVVRICVANSSSGWLAGLTDKVLPEEYAFAAMVADGKHFPVRAVVIANGAEQMRMEVSKFEKGPVAPALLAVPADYQKKDLFELLGTMMRLGGSPFAQGQ